MTSMPSTASIVVPSCNDPWAESDERDRPRSNLVSIEVRSCGHSIDAPLFSPSPVTATMTQHLFTGTICGGTSVVAWNPNLRSSFGVSTDLKTELATQVAALLPPKVVATGLSQKVQTDATNPSSRAAPHHRSHRLPRCPRLGVHRLRPRRKDVPQGTLRPRPGTRLLHQRGERCNRGILRFVVGW